MVKAEIVICVYPKLSNQASKKTLGHGKPKAKRKLFHVDALRDLVCNGCDVTSKIPLHLLPGFLWSFAFVYCHLPFIEFVFIFQKFVSSPPKNTRHVHQGNPQSFPTFNPQGVHRAIEHDPVMVLGSTNAVVRPSPAHLRRAFVTNEITSASIDSDFCSKTRVNHLQQPILHKQK